MKKNTISVSIQIEKIEVEDGYFTINFKPYLNGVPKKSMEYNSDFQNGMTDKQWLKSLQNGGAVVMALQQFVETL